MNIARQVPLFALLVCAVLAGCTETRFESAPDVALQSCDARWKGLWVPRDEPNGSSAFYIDDDCNFIVFDHPDRGGPIKRVPLHVRFGRVDKQDLMILADKELTPLVEIDPVYGVKPAPNHAYFYARYDMHKGHVAVYPVDSERVAARIIRGKLKGTVSKTVNELHVFVSGDGAKMRDMLRRESIFAGKPDFVLVRSKRPLGEFEQMLGKPASGNDG